MEGLQKGDKGWGGVGRDSEGLEGLEKSERGVGRVGKRLWRGGRGLRKGGIVREEWKKVEDG